MGGARAGAPLSASRFRGTLQALHWPAPLGFEEADPAVWDDSCQWGSTAHRITLGRGRGRDFWAGGSKGASWMT